MYASLHGVQVAREHDMPPNATHRRVLLRGDPGSVAAAKAEINKIMEDRGRGPGGPGGGSHYGPGNEGQSITVQIPDQQVGLIIGKQGSTIRGIQDRTGANIQIPSVADANDPSTRTVTISGPSERECAMAADEIKGLVAERLGGGGGGGGGGGDSPPLYIQIPNAHVGLVIGKAGSTIRAIQDVTSSPSAESPLPLCPALMLGSV